MTPSEQCAAAAAALRQPHPGAAITATSAMAALLRAREPLADWLDAEAARLAATAHPYWQDTVAPHAVAVARAILGGQL